MSVCCENLFGPFCDVHDMTKATAACCLHQNLLCFECFTSHIRNVENSQLCKLQQISERSEEDPDYVRLVINKELERKSKIIDRYDEEARKQQGELKKDIADASDKLLELVNKLKPKAMESLSDKVKDLLEKHQQEREAVTSFRQEHSNVLDGTPTDDESSKREQLPKLKDILKQLRDKYTDKKSTLEAKFQLDIKIEQLFKSESVKLGEVIIYEEDRYETINEAANTQLNLQESKSPDGDVRDAEQETGEQSKAQPVINQQISISSDEADNSKEKKSPVKRNSKSPDDKPKSSIFGLLFKSKPDGSRKKSGKDSLSDKAATEQTTKKTKESDCQLKDYAHAKFPDRTVIIPRSLINTAKDVNQSSLQQLSLGYKFEQLVYLENGKLCLFSPLNKKIAVVKLHESTPVLSYLQTVEENMNSLVKIGPDTIGLLCRKKQTIYEYRVDEKLIQHESTIPFKGCFKDITGFDFDGQDKFAISSPSEVLEVDKKSKVQKKRTYWEVSDIDSTKIRTIYDFTKDVVYVLNTERATLKRIKVETQNPDWKIKMDQNIAVKNFSLYKDQLCIVSRDKISQIATECGKALMQQDTNDLIKDCLGICVTDDVIILTSDPCDGAQNTKLAFKSF